eukprot:13174924-Alexandrium_andersonii.AAC.1
MSVLGAEGIGSALHLGSTLALARVPPLSMFRCTHHRSLLSVADGRPARPCLCPQCLGSGLHV